MRNPSLALVACVGLAVAASACAHDVHARLPAAPGDPTGTVELVFTSASAGVTVAVNGVLVVSDERTERVRIDGVPTGYADLVIAAGSGEKQLRVWVESDHVTAIPLGASGEAPMSAIRALATSLAGIALYSLLN